MSNTFLTWLLAAAVAGLGLFFFLGAPENAGGSLTTNGAAPMPGTATYWQSVASPVPAPAPATVALAASAQPAPPCTSCSITLATSATISAATPAPPADSVALAGGCGGPAVPCGGSSCGAVKTCPAAALGPAPCERAPASPCGGSKELEACGHTACPSCGCAACPVSTCPATLSCPLPLCDDRPKISRNNAQCVEECTFVQFFSIVPRGLCESARYAWAATRGRFLDPASPAPIYYTPNTSLSGGEDVLITLTVTDGYGNEYADQIKVHVSDAD
jgi:hypothetical protein